MPNPWANNGAPLLTEHDDEIVRLYALPGRSQAQVASEVGVCAHTVLKALRRRGVPSKPRGRPLYTDGFLRRYVAEISDRLGHPVGSKEADRASLPGVTPSKSTLKGRLCRPGETFGQMVTRLLEEK